MLNSFLKSRISDAKKLQKELMKYFDYASVLGSFTTQKRVIISTHSESVDDIDSECGFVIKVYKNGKYSEYSCTDIKGLKAKTVIDSVTLKNVYSDKFNVAMLTEEKIKKDFKREDEKPLSDLEIIKRLTKVKDYYHKYDKRVVNASCIYAKRENSRIFISSNKELTQKYDWVNAIAAIVVSEDGKVKEHYDSFGEASSLKALTALEKNKKSDMDIAIKLLDAKPIKPGKYEIITDPSISGLIAHEAFGHGVEMDMFVKNRAKAKNYVNKYVASPIVNMYDGAAACVSSASYFFDDDGILAHKTQIIKDGILINGISDSLSALVLGKEPTGNGRRESYKRKVYTRMTNTFFGAGKDKLDDMIKSIKHGYMLYQTNNGMEDPKNWQIQCTASYGLEIKDGKFTGNVVAPVVISGYVVDLLSSISMVSDKVTVHGSGMCGKGHKEWVYVSDGGPYLKAEAKLG